MSSSVISAPGTNIPGLPSTTMLPLAGGQEMSSRVAAPVISWLLRRDLASSTDLSSSLSTTRRMWSLLGWADISRCWVVLTLWSHSNSAGNLAITLWSWIHGSWGKILDPDIALVLFFFPFLGSPALCRLLPLLHGQAGNALARAPSPPRGLA